MMLLKNEVKNVRTLELAHNIIRFLSKAQIQYFINQHKKFSCLISQSSGNGYKTEIPDFYLLLSEIVKTHGKDTSDYKLEPKSISLGRDPILSFPWNPDRLNRAFKMIRKGEWKQDPRNHVVYVWDPFVALVYNGYHSISVGICREEGILKDNEIIIQRYTILPVFNKVAFNLEKRQYKWIDTGKGILKIKENRPGAMLFGIAYEIARRSYFSESIKDLKDDTIKYIKQVKELVGSWKDCF